MSHLGTFSTTDVQNHMCVQWGTPIFKRLLLTDGREYEGADDHEDGLHEVGPDDGRESSGDGEQARDAQQDQDGDVDGVLALDLKLIYVLLLQ